MVDAQGSALDNLARLRLPTRRVLPVALAPDVPVLIADVIAADAGMASSDPAAAAVVVRRAGSDFGAELPALELVPAATQTDAFVIGYSDQDAHAEHVLRAGRGSAWSRSDRRRRACEHLAAPSVRGGRTRCSPPRRGCGKSFSAPSTTSPTVAVFRVFVTRALRYLAADPVWHSYVAAGKPLPTAVGGAPWLGRPDPAVDLLGAQFAPARAGELSGQAPALIAALLSEDVTSGRPGVELPAYTAPGGGCGPRHRRLARATRARPARGRVGPAPARVDPLRRRRNARWNWSFLQPHMAWLLLAVPLVWFLPGRPRSRTQAALRTLVLLLVIAALARPVLVTPRAGGHQAVVLDVSSSVAEQARESALALATRLAANGEHEVTVLQLGGAAPAADEGGPVAATGHRQRIAARAAPICRSICAQSIPTGSPGAITLLSDGRATDKHWGKALAQLLERGLPVHALPFGERERAVLGEFANPAHAPRRKRPHRRRRGSVPGGGLEVVLRREEALLERSGLFDSDGRHTVVLELQSGAAGFHPFTAELANPAAAAHPGSRRDGVLVVQEPARVLYLGERQQGARERLQALVGDGFALASEQAVGEAF